MDWLNDLFRSAVTVGEDLARSALGVRAPDSAAKQGEAKGADTTARQATEAMPRWLWAVLAGLVALALVLAARRR